MERQLFVSGLVGLWSIVLLVFLMVMDLSIKSIIGRMKIFFCCRLINQTNLHAD